MLTLQAVVKASGVPEFVKSASIPEAVEYDYSTKEATYLSYVQALIKNADADTLSDACDYAKFWGIAADCAKAKEKIAGLMQTPELADSDYALVAEDRGHKIQKYAAYDGLTTVNAAEAFYENREKYPYEWRGKIAQNLLTKSAQYCAILPQYLAVYLEKAAAYGAAGIGALEDAMILREQACPAEHSDSFEKVAVLIEAMIDDEKLRTDHDFVKEAVSVIDQFDTLIGFKQALAEDIIPDELVLSNLQKLASADKNIVKLANGFELDVRDLTKDDLNAVDCKLASMSIEELQDVLPTLPRSDADLLTRILV